jgi:hypothetical protein
MLNGILTSNWIISLQTSSGGFRMADVAAVATIVLFFVSMFAAIALIERL